MDALVELVQEFAPSLTSQKIRSVAEMVGMNDPKSEWWFEEYEDYWDNDAKKTGVPPHIFGRGIPIDQLRQRAKEITAQCHEDMSTRVLLENDGQITVPVKTGAIFGSINDGISPTVSIFTDTGGGVGVGFKEGGRRAKTTIANEHPNGRIFDLITSSR